MFLSRHAGLMLSILLSVVLLFLALLTGCAGMTEGESVDLVTVATPAQPQPAHTTRPPAPTGLVVGPTQGKAWIPAVTQANGDKEEGHWLVFDKHAPLLEQKEPVAVIPKAPRTSFTKLTKERQPAGQRERESQPQAPQGTSLPQLSQEMPTIPQALLQQIPGMSQGPSGTAPDMNAVMQQMIGLSQGKMPSSLPGGQ